MPKKWSPRGRVRRPAGGLPEFRDGRKTYGPGGQCRRFDDFDSPSDGRRRDSPIPAALMADHFRTVGFTLEPSELQSLLQRALGGGTVIEAPHGDYRVWTPGAGAELWVNLYRLDGKRRELAGANPHFAGDARMHAIVEGIEPNPDFALEGELYAWASPHGDEHGLYPFSASVPDFDASLAKRDVPFRAELALAGFAHELRWWADETGYRQSLRDEPTGFATTSFLPIGLFGSNTGRARSQCVVTGTIRACETRINPATERAFWRLRMETYGGEVDVLAAPDVVRGQPPLGGIVRATCWLTARIVSSDDEEA